MTEVFFFYRKIEKNLQKKTNRAEKKILYSNDVFQQNVRIITGDSYAHRILRGMGI